MDLTEATLERASLYGLFAKAFAYPNEETLSAIRSSTKIVSDVLSATKFKKDLRKEALEFAKIASLTSLQELHNNYSRLFVGRRHCNLEESEYDKAVFNRYHRLADVAGFYRAFGFEVSEGSHQRADFIGTELEFMQVLMLKRLYADHQGWSAKAEVCLSTERNFIKEHLEWWVPLLCEKMQADSECPFYSSLSNFLDFFVRGEASRCLQPA
jgi:DMSO reductase family type II enzyme chaperone